MKEFLKTILYQPLYNLLIFFAWLVPGHSIGWAIIMLTILIRLILLPASIKAARAQVKLQALQPKINKLRAEIKDQQEQGRALMKLYKDEDASPFGSCLPLLIQLPIIFILYRVFTVGLDESRFSMLYSFTPRPDQINTIFFGVDLAKPEAWVLPILAGALQFVLSKMTMPPVQSNKSEKTEGSQMPDAMTMANKQMVYLFPIMTIFIARSLPAALAIYWIVTTLFGVLQQLYVNKTIKLKKNTDGSTEDFDIEKYKNLPAKGPLQSTSSPKKKKDFMTKVMSNRLDKQEKKSGVEVTIRTKK